MNPNLYPDNGGQVRFKYMGEWLTLRELSKKTGLSVSCLYGRLCGRNKHRWTFEKAVTTPALKKSPRWTRDQIIEHLRSGAANE